MSYLLENSIVNSIKIYTTFFLNKKNVVGIGLGNKIIKNIDTKEPCIHVMVKNKKPLNELYKNDIIPKKFLGINTDVIETGEFKQNNSSDFNLPENIILRFRKRPIQPGYSIGPEGVAYSGTLGCIVFDEYNIPYILGNNHVLADENKLKIGTAILQPGVQDGGNISENIVAQLSEFIHLNFEENNQGDDGNFADAAIAEIFPEIKYTTFIHGIGNITGTIEGKIGMKIRKTGITTGITEGIITSTHVITPLKMFNGEYCIFYDQLYASKMSEEGDSGSLVLNYFNKVVGLLVGGGKGGSLISPITPILKYFNVRLRYNE
ncbi:MAG: hypothetical protein ACRC7R_02380 [Sarcina sp.]